MTKDPSISKKLAFWLDEQPVSCEEVMAILRKDRKLPAIVRELVLDHALRSVNLPSDVENAMLIDFRQHQKLDNDEEFLDFLQKAHLDEKLLKEMVSRPQKVVQYREERWGPRANSLYLKHKDRYDKFTYRRLQSSNPDVMQEVYFRLKDKEDTWESLARQFPGAKPDADGRIQSVSVSQVEPALVDALRQAGSGVLIRPLQLNSGTVVVAELESIEASQLDDELRTEIIRQEFDNWLAEESTKMLSKLRVPA